MRPAAFVLLEDRNERDALAFEVAAQKLPQHPPSLNELLRLFVRCREAALAHGQREEDARLAAPGVPVEVALADRRAMLAVPALAAQGADNGQRSIMLDK